VRREAGEVGGGRKKQTKESGGEGGGAEGRKGRMGKKSRGKYRGVGGRIEEERGERKTGGGKGGRKARMGWKSIGSRLGHSFLNLKESTRDWIARKALNELHDLLAPQRKEGKRQAPYPPVQDAQARNLLI